MKGRVKSIFAGVSISLGAFAYLITLQKTNNIFLSSLVPVMGFLLSTLSLKWVRKVWEKKNV